MLGCIAKDAVAFDGQRKSPAAAQVSRPHSFGHYSRAHRVESDALPERVLGSGILVTEADTVSAPRVIPPRSQSISRVLGTDWCR